MGPTLLSNVPGAARGRSGQYQLPNWAYQIGRANVWAARKVTDVAAMPSHIDIHQAVEWSRSRPSDRSTVRRVACAEPAGPRESPLDCVLLLLLVTLVSSCHVEALRLVTIRRRTFLCGICISAPDFPPRSQPAGFSPISVRAYQFFVLGFTTISHVPFSHFDGKPTVDLGFPSTSCSCK